MSTSALRGAAGRNHLSRVPAAKEVRSSRDPQPFASAKSPPRRGSEGRAPDLAARFAFPSVGSCSPRTRRLPRTPATCSESDPLWTVSRDFRVPGPQSFASILFCGPGRGAKPPGASVRGSGLSLLSAGAAATRRRAAAAGRQVQSGFVLVFDFCCCCLWKRNEPGQETGRSGEDMFGCYFLAIKQQQQQAAPAITCLLSSPRGGGRKVKTREKGPLREFSDRTREETPVRPAAADQYSAAYPMLNPWHSCMNAEMPP